ncbi:Uncharacterised protein [Mycolicibacterium vanbaalenii]|uniref:Secreted protein n=1 Tax=Mycolicibacterium vanbaalenii TaxID=110539 RepID=A0A5S9MWP0_MYCVN|nr:hypothetical protein [Mycolicibacterium vanbaalenii]CAA0080792.1 Uncharacterised protein [Mycolicibacterium vanbaalenii]
MVAATSAALALFASAPGAQAAVDTADASIPVDPVTAIEVHTTADCVRAVNQCFFTASANLRTPAGAIGFPDDLWARQTTTLRSMDRSVYLDSSFVGENTRMFKSIGPVEFTTIYFGGGPVEKYQLRGNTWPTDWSTGQPKLDADYIVCSHIQVVYAGVNLTTPDACSQTTFS